MRAVQYPLMITWGLIPSSMNCFASLRSSPAKIITEVVPSPTSLSWLLATSARDFAAGWSMLRSLMIVAPSFEIVDESSVHIILSIPRGPNVVLITSTTAWQALMLLMICSFPWRFSVPCLRTKMFGWSIFIFKYIRYNN